MVFQLEHLLMISPAASSTSALDLHTKQNLAHWRRFCLDMTPHRRRVSAGEG